MDRDGLDLSARSVAGGPETGGAPPQRRSRASWPPGDAPCRRRLLGLAGGRLERLHPQASRTFTSMATMAADAVGSSLQRDDDLGQTARTLVQSTPAMTNQRFSMWFRLLGGARPLPGVLRPDVHRKRPASSIGGFSPPESWLTPDRPARGGAVHRFPTEVQPSVLFGAPAVAVQSPRTAGSPLTSPRGAIGVYGSGSRLLRHLPSAPCCGPLRAPVRPRPSPWRR